MYSTDPSFDLQPPLRHIHCELESTANYLASGLEALKNLCDAPLDISASMRSPFRSGDHAPKSYS